MEAKQVTDACKLTYGYKERKKTSKYCQTREKRKDSQKEQRKIAKIKKGMQILIMHNM